MDSNLELLKIFPEMLATWGGGGGSKIFPVVSYRNGTFFTKLFKKLGNFQTKRAPLKLI